MTAPSAAAEERQAAAPRDPLERRIERASIGQASLWFLRQVMPYKAPYNTAIRFRLTGALNVAALRAGLDEIVRRHESFRTTFRAVDGVVEQVIHPELTPDIAVVDTSAEADPSGAADSLSRAAARELFDLEKGPLLRARIVRIDPREHVLVVVMDHIVADGMSFGIMWRELEELYAAFAAGAGSPLPPPKKQYVECVEAQNRWLASPPFAKQVEFWKQHLAGASPCDLPTDRPRPPVKSYRGNMTRSVLSRELVKRLDDVARAEGTSIFAVLLAGLEVLMARYSGQRDITVLVPVACRMRWAAEAVIGYFANVIVLRNEVADDAPFRSLLKAASAETYAGLLRQDVPFERVVEATRPERSLSHDPLASVGLSFLPARGSRLELPGIVARYEEISNGGSKFDLHLFVAEVAGELTVTTEYNADIFDESTVERLNEHYGVLLGAIADDVTTPIGQLPLMSRVERQRVLVEWNATSAPYPSDATLPSLVRARAEAAPTAPAVRFEDAVLTYGELERRSNQVARALRGRGAREGTLVGIAMERSASMVVALLGILKAGAAYVPLDPSYPRDRLATMVEDSGLPLLVTQSSLSGVVQAASSLRMDADAVEIDAQSEAPLDSGTTAASIAYVIYTSGSTGRPKGVPIPHRALVNFLTSMGREPGLSPSDRLLAVTSISFDIAGLEIWLPLVTGAEVVIASRSTATDGAALARLLEAGGITTFQATPSTYRLLLEAGWRGSSSLKALIGGEATPPGLAEELSGKTGSLWNMYGPTETTIWSCVHPLRRGHPVFIGRPIANTRVYVLDRNLQPTPPGVTGEVYLGGDGLAVGYLGRPELTAERFVPDPFAGEAGARMYRTGDLGRLRAGGVLEYQGRNDFQVKLRGFRIELGEIEATLATHGDVREAVVTLYEEGPGDQRLAAYVTSDARPEPDALREYLRAKLPEYMVPSRFVQLERLPLTANGKVDRKALPKPERAAGDANRPTAMPTEVVEIKLRAIWEEVLRHPSIGIDDNFFDLGGHSLLALKLFDRIQSAFGTTLPVATIFEAPTVRAMAGILRALGWKPKWTSLVPIQPAGTKRPFFCVHGGGALVIFYYPLSKRLGNDQPFYGLQPRALSVHDVTDPNNRSVEAMAAHYLEEVREVQPTGPYMLGGASYGGSIALEMAQQLIAVGETVGLVAMFDTYGPGYYRPAEGPLERLQHLPFNVAYRLEHHAGSMMGLPRGERSAYARDKVSKAIEEARESLGDSSRRFARGFFERMGRPIPRDLEEARNVVNEAVARYEPRPYDGSITLFRARRQAPGTRRDPTLGWGAIARGGVEIIPMPGFHAAMISEPRVQVLAPALAARMARV